MAGASSPLPRVAYARGPLAEGLLDGDARAFADFYDFFFPRVWRHARRRSADAAAAERMTAAIFEAVIEGLAQPLSDGELARLVFDVARCVAAGARAGESRS
jgi:DNA-directed RNA polymerase specialized sigma24 family protein